MPARPSARRRRRDLVADLRNQGHTRVSIAAEIRRLWPELTAFAALRLAHGWTQQDAADAWTALWPDRPKAAKDIGLWENWPSGSGRRPSLDTLDRLAQVYHCSMADLVVDVSTYRHLDPVYSDDSRGFGPAAAAKIMVDRQSTSTWISLESQDRWHLRLRGAEILDETSATVQVVPAAQQGDNYVLDLPDESARAGLIDSADRSYLLGSLSDGESVVADTAALRRAGSAEQRISVSSAYRLDDITYALLWASACLDDGLLAVDDALGEEERSFGTYLQLERSSVTRSSADHLTGAGRAWLGSSFCARHVQARLSAASAEALPVFWTREQTGEEAATWLFFAHKHRYLHAIDRLLGGEPTRRVFCLPEDAVGKLPAHERILLFLAIAQMELNKVVVTIVPDPTYQELDGFVLVPDHQAVVANWIRGDGVWAVDTLDHRRTVRWYSDAVGDATIRSITTAASAAHRLQDVANYLELDWTNLTGRCGELSEPGIAGMIHTRSRRVTLSELDRVLRYVGSLTA